MKNYTIILVVCILTFLATYTFAEQEYAPGRLMVKFHRASMESNEFQLNTVRGIASTGLVSLDQLNSQYNVSHIKKAFREVNDKALEHELGIDCWYMFTLPETYEITAVAAQYKDDSHIAAATPDWEAFPMTDDTHYSSQWGHNNTGQMPSFNIITGEHDGDLVGTTGFDGNIEAAWTNLGTYRSSSIIIGIIDSGVDLDHPDLAGNLLIGYDFGDNDTDPNDDSNNAGHGTACAGIAAALTNNTTGIAGVAGSSEIMPLKVMNQAGTMYFSAITNAITHAADNGVSIASMSLGNMDVTSDEAMDAAIYYAYTNGVTLLAATGNDNTNRIGYPACNSYVISVGAASPCEERKSPTSCDGETWWGSNYGDYSQDVPGAVDIIAPTIIPATDIAGSGGYIDGDYYLYFNGTSASTPFAAGVCALIKSKYPDLTPAEIRHQLVQTADDVVNTESGSGWDQYSGHGMVNAGAALGSLVTNNSPVFIASGPFTVNEGLGEGATVADIDAGNGDGGGADGGITYSITVNTDPDGDGKDAFAINSITGVLTVNDAGDINYSYSPLTITVKADDGVNQTTTDVTINLNDITVHVYYVDAGASGANNGTSWTDAFTSLQSALAVAVSLDSIYVKYGTYKPTTGTDRNATFTIPSGVAVFGHFAGIESNSSQRDLSNETYETILSGDLNGDDSGFTNNGENSYHVVTFSGASTLTSLDGFTIAHGYGGDAGTSGYGAGIYIGGGDPTIRNCTITYNLGSSCGGGIFNAEGSSPIFDNCKITNNKTQSGGLGGGMYNSDDCSPVIKNCTFSGNWAYQGASIFNEDSCPPYGTTNPKIINCIFENHSGEWLNEGVIANHQCNLEITNCIFRNNSVYYRGGAIYNYKSWLKVTGCAFTGNRQDNQSGSGDNMGGGAIYNRECPSIEITNSVFDENQAFNGTTYYSLYGGAILNLSSSATIKNCEFKGNLANTTGGAIHNNGSSANIINCIFTGNQSQNNSNGGAISNVNSNDVVLTNCTISGNRASDYGGGIYNESSNPTINNTIIWGNYAANGNEIYNNSSSPTFSYCSIQGCGGSGSWDGSIGVDGGNNIDSSPAFLDPKHFSTAPTSLGDYHMCTNSAAINAGSNALVPVGTTTDLDGEDRIQNAIVDMGAYEGSELDQIIFVKYDATGLDNGTNWANAYTDLQDALGNVAAGGQIYIARGTYKPGTNRTDSFVIPSGVKIYGHFAGTEGSPLERTLNNSGYKTILSGDIGTENNNSDNSYHVVTFNTAADTTILDGVTISHGNGDGSDTYNSGGGIYITNSSPVIQNCIISGNSAAYGGGIFNSDNSTPTLINCVITGNNAATSGGAMSNSASSPVIINSSISGNNAATNGGAIYNDNCSPIIKNTILWGNNTTGGVIYNNGTCTPTYAYSNIETSGGSTNWNTAFGTDNGNNIDVNPLFLADAPDYTLAPTTEGNVCFYGSSPCKNTGNNADIPSNIIFDLIGRYRIEGTVDMGAYEGELDENYYFYVKADASGSTKGTSWENAFNDLQEALIRATSDDTVYVASGTYKPTATTDLSISFVIPSGVAVYGHFAGTESPPNPNQRELSNSAYKTILSGDIGTENDNSDNSGRVVLFSNANNSTILDGFTITDANAGYNGGGIACHGSSPIILNSIIRNNNGNWGGGLASQYASNPTIINCIFTGNSASYGGAIFNGDNNTGDRSVYTLINCTIYGNSASWKGGALSSKMSGDWGFHPQIKNTIIWGNGGNPIDTYYWGGFVFYNCDIQYSGGSSGWVGYPASDDVDYSLDGGGNLDIDPQFVDAANGDFRLIETSPCINVGNNDYIPAGIQFDLDGAARIQNVLVDMGVYEKLLTTPYVVTSSITNVTKTTATGGGNVMDEGASEVTAKGICWNTTGLPTISDSKATDGSGSGSFTSNLTGLTESTLYYVRAYATNSYGTAYGTEVTFTTAMDPPGYVLDFDGTDDYVSIPDSPGISIIGNITVEAWLNLAATGTDQGIVEKWGWSDGGYNLRIQADGKAIFATIDDATNFDNVTSNTTIGTNQWYHLAGVWDASTLRIYVNGVLDNSVASTRNPKDGATPLIIGARGLYDASFFNGEMDEVRIWNIARTQQEIQDNMNQIIDPVTSGLVAYYRFDEMTGTTLSDLTTNGNDGTLTNMDDTDWVQSLAPFGETGAYVDNTTPTSVGDTGKQMQVTITSTPDASNFLEIYTTGDGTGEVVAEIFPSNITRRPNIFWGVVEVGSVTADLVFDYNNISGISHLATLKLLKRSDPTQDWVDVTGDFTHDTGAKTFSGTGVTEFSEFSLGDASLPAVTTSSITDITQTTATGGGNITYEGASAITAKGVCWNTTGSPTLSDNFTTNGTGTGSFTSNLTGLAETTLYYVRAYATNSEGTSYGEEVTFITPLEPPGNALDFDGSDDYVNAGEWALPNTGLTVEGWVKTSNNAKSYQTIAAQYSGWPGTTSYILRLDDGKPGFYLSNGSGFVINSTEVLANNTWYHIAGTFDNITAKLYVNGIPKASNSFTGPVLQLASVFHGIGGSQGAGEYFTGQIDEVRIWNVARTQQEIQDSMNQIIDPATSGLVAYYRFDHLTGTTLGDLTANGNHGTLTNMTDADWVQSLAPLGDNGAYVNTTTPTPVGNAGLQMQVTITSTPDANNFLQIYAVGDGNGGVTNETFPSGVSRRFNIFWGVEEFGSITADLVFDYSGIGGITNPAAVRLLKRNDATSDWVDVTGNFTHDTGARTFTGTGFTEFSEFSPGDGGENPLPVELQDFYAEVIPGGIQLHWSTASEVNNAGFKVYRKAGDLPGFQNLEGLIEGAGTTSEPQQYSFTDKDVQPNILYTYQIADVEEGTNKETLHPPITIMATKDALQSKEIPKAFALHANYPNPFNPTTTIEFDIPDLTGFKNLFDLTLKIYDASGKLVKTLVDEPMEPGYHSVVWDGKDDNGRAVNSGMYIYKMRTEGYSKTRRCVMLK